MRLNKTTVEAMARQAMKVVEEANHDLYEKIKRSETVRLRATTDYNKWESISAVGKDGQRSTMDDFTRVHADDVYSLEKSTIKDVRDIMDEIYVQLPNVKVTAEIKINAIEK